MSFCSLTPGKLYKLIEGAYTCFPNIRDAFVIHSSEHVILYLGPRLSRTGDFLIHEFLINDRVVHFSAAINADVARYFIEVQLS